MKNIKTRTCLMKNVKTRPSLMKNVKTYSPSWSILLWNQIRVYEKCIISALIYFDCDQIDQPVER